nr:MAG TPA: hypothetical protein [Herelleviridae sp.]
MVGQKKQPVLWVSTHSRPKAAGSSKMLSSSNILVSTHSRPKAAGKRRQSSKASNQFQHTAARRRLGQKNT